MCVLNGWSLEMDKSVARHTESSKCDKTGATMVRKFSRAELFRIGKTVGTTLDAKILDSFEHADWTHYDLDLVDETNGPQSLPLRSLASFGRKHSEFGQHNEQLFHAAMSLGRPMTQVKLPYRLSNNEMHSIGGAFLARGQATRPTSHNSGSNSSVTNVLTRMTSSPSIDYNIGGLKSPAKVSPSSAQSLGFAGKMPERGFQRHGPNGSFTDQQTKLSRLYGPLRRDHSRQLDSESEPLSLPYDLVNGINNGYSSLHKFDTSLSKDELSTQRVSDGIGSSPVQRITAKVSERRADERDNNTNISSDNVDGANDDDDDFDVTKLMSITVLSDIRTIRPNAFKFSEPKLTRQSSTGAPRLSKMRSQDGYMPTRMSSRSRTSLDLSYQRRASFRDTYSSRNINRPGSYADEDFEYEPVEYQSLDMSANYHQMSDRPRRVPAQYQNVHLQTSSSNHSVDLRSEMAPLSLEQTWTPTMANAPRVREEVSSRFSSLKTTTTKTCTPQDSEAARIIENFKAQVRARAKAQLDDTSSRNGAIRDKSNNVASEDKPSDQQSNIGLEKSPRSGSQGAVCKTDRKCQVESHESVVDASHQANNEAVVLKEISNEKVSNSGEISKAEQQLDESVITVIGTSGKENKNPHDNVESKSTHTTTTKCRASNIPRLISLQRTKFASESSGGGTDQVTEQANSGATTDSTLKSSALGVQQMQPGKATLSTTSAGKRLSATKSITK